MSKLLKGNYRLPGQTTKPDAGGEETPTEEFERRALERLGGSIAFVMKRNTFVWNGEEKGRDGAGESAASER